jgi:hypothetical protein
LTHILTCGFVFGWTPLDPQELFPKLRTRVRFPSLAPDESPAQALFPGACFAPGDHVIARSLRAPPAEIGGPGGGRGLTATYLGVSLG